MKFEQIVIEPNSSETNYWRDIWKYRDLIYILSWRDIKVRYKQTALGVVWALIKPLLTMAVFVVVFGDIAGMKNSSKVPYPLIVIAGLIPWQFFSTAFTACSESLIANSNLLTKVYFPRLIIPISAVLTSLVDYFISYTILVFLLLFYRFEIGYSVFYVLPFTLIIFLFSFSLGLLFATLNVKYRDFRYIIPFIVQFGLYITPVGFSTAAIPSNLRKLININPLTNIIDGFRYSFFSENTTSPFNYFFITLLLLIYSVYNFRKFEKTFADII
jgi:lipopolysaccharide transport system permease protein